MLQAMLSFIRAYYSGPTETIPPQGKAKANRILAAPKPFLLILSQTLRTLDPERVPLWDMESL